MFFWPCTVRALAHGRWVYLPGNESERPITEFNSATSLWHVARNLKKECRVPINALEDYARHRVHE